MSYYISLDAKNPRYPVTYSPNELFPTIYKYNSVQYGMCLFIDLEMNCINTTLQSIHALFKN